MKNKLQTPILSTIALFLLLGYTTFAQVEVPTISGTINENNLKNYSYNFCRYSRNEIFARMGYIFKSKDLDLYFSAQPWYEKKINASISLTDNQKYFIELFQATEKQKTAKQNKSMLVDGYPVFLVDKTAYLLPKEFSWALQITTLPKEYIAAKAIDKIVSENPIENYKGINLVVAYDYVGSDIESCYLSGVENGKFNYLFSTEGYSLKAGVNNNEELLISGRRKSYLCGMFITDFEYLYSPKTGKALMLPVKQDVFTTTNEISHALEIENKEDIPYKITLPVGTQVTITKYLAKPNCYFIESKLGSGWIYGELCQHFYLVG